MKFPTSEIAFISGYSVGVPRQRIDRAAVVSAAVALADTEGLHEVALGRVADDLGVQASALYNHIDGVDALRHEVAVQALANLSSTLRDAAVARAGEDALVSVANAYRAFAMANPGQYASTLLPPADAEDQLRSDNWTITELFVQILAAFDIEGDHAVHTARALRSAIHGFVALETVDAFGQPQPTDASFEHLIELIVAGARATA